MQVPAFEPEFVWGRRQKALVASGHLHALTTSVQLPLLQMPLQVPPWPEAQLPWIREELELADGRSQPPTVSAWQDISQVLLTFLQAPSRHEYLHVPVWSLAQSPSSDEPDATPDRTQLSTVSPAHGLGEQVSLTLLHAP